MLQFLLVLICVVISITFALLILILPGYMYRQIFQLLVPKLWARSYFRRAVDCSMVTFFILFWSTMSQMGGAGHIRDDMYQWIQNKESAIEAPRPPESWHGFSLAYGRLSFLSSLQFFLNYLPYAVTPPLAVYFIGYSVERHRKEGGKASAQDTIVP